MSSARPALVLVPVVIGAVTALALGIYAGVHQPTGRGLVFVDADRVGDVKTGLTVLVVVLVGVQLLLGMRLRSSAAVGGSQRSDTAADTHRLVGTLAFACSLPVAFHCVWALGYRSDDTVFLVHSLVGCLVYGLYAAKVVAVRLGDPSSALVPALGAGLGAAFVIVAASAL